MPDDTWSEERIAETRHRLAGPMLFPAADLRTDVLSLLDALESARERADGLNDAFEDVMGALAKALDGCEDYAERPAELVWRLRDQRDEATTGLGAAGERLHYMERYLRDPAGSVSCTDRAAFDPPCGGCEGCITAQVIFGITGKAVVG